jgi:hypothetical protein
VLVMFSSLTERKDLKRPVLYVFHSITTEHS